MMFLVSGVHPFEDGNERIAKVMMDAELVNQNQKDAAPSVQMLGKAHAFSEDLHFDNYDDFYNYLVSHNAFYEPHEGRRLIAVR